MTVTTTPPAKPDLSDYLALWWYGEIRLPEERLLAWLQRNRLMALLGWRAEAEGWNLPETISEAIRRHRLLIAVSQVLTDQQLKALGETAQQLDIPVVLVKGAAAAQAYPQPWMRPFGDIDLLVDEKDAGRFVEALKAQGYTWAESSEGMRAWHLPPMSPQGRGPRVEIHHALAWNHGQRNFTLEAWSTCIKPSSYPGFLTPEAVEHVLYLVHHGIVQHEFMMGAQLLTDLWFWTRTWSTNNWEKLAREAGETNLQRAVGLAFALATWFWNESLGAGAPDLFPIPDSAILDSAKEAIAGFNTVHLPGVWRDIPSRDVRGILTYGKTILFSDPAQLSELTFAERAKHQLLRPIKLIQNHGPAVWHLIRGDPATRDAWRSQRDLQTWLRGKER